MSITDKRRVDDEHLVITLSSRPSCKCVVLQQCGSVQLDCLIFLKVKKNLPTIQPPLPLCAKTLRFRLKKVRCDLSKNVTSGSILSDLDKMEG